jgi:hypothetical protein
MELRNLMAYLKEHTCRHTVYCVSYSQTIPFWVHTIILTPLLLSIFACHVTKSVL